MSIYDQIAQGFNPGGGAVQAEAMRQQQQQNALARQMEQRKLGMQERQLGMQEQAFGLKQQAMAQQQQAQLRENMIKGVAWAQSPEQWMQLVGHYEAQGIPIPPQFKNVTPENFEQVKKQAFMSLTSPEQQYKAMYPEQPKPTSLMQNLQAAGYEQGSPEYQQAIRAATTKPQAVATIEAQEPGPDIKGERDLRKEFREETQDFVKVRDSFDRITASAKNPTPAGDLSMIFNYMKMLDPGSVVRESEFEVASRAKPMIENMGLSWEAVKAAWEGKRLTPRQRADFVNRAKMLYRKQNAQFGQTKAYYSKLASQYGYTPERIVRDIAVTPDDGGGDVPASEMSDDDLSKGLGF